MTVGSGRTEGPRTVLDPRDLFHVGYVVPDVEAAREQLGGTGQSFLPTVHSRRDVTLHDDPPHPGGSVEAQVTFLTTYSLGHPHVELVQSVPGTLWACGDEPRLHHVGYWVDDLAAATALLDRSGLRQVASSAIWSYHRWGGSFVEVVDAGIRPVLEQRWRDGRVVGAQAGGGHSSRAR